eukprot:TRINITY_DN38120_c0_g1_i1.p1 TRINITY_DN38120_c0_g1~~TRINITY_DN38120_c0_g1_i1.p1  ORF type:complete len:152 (-),score=16.33 TRINITY_DN38120_c0_g1_i1:33-488(-)
MHVVHVVFVFEIEIRQLRYVCRVNWCDCELLSSFLFFFFNETATTEIYTLHIVGSVRCVQETAIVIIQLISFYRWIEEKKIAEIDLLQFLNLISMKRKFFLLVVSCFCIAGFAQSQEKVLKQYGFWDNWFIQAHVLCVCLLYTSPSPRDQA